MEETGKTWLETRTIARLLLLLLYCLVLSAILQQWVGGSTVYHKWRYDSHLTLHTAIIENKPPDGKTWKTMGASGVNTRILVPFTVQTVHNVLGVPLSSLYWWSDFVFLTATLFSLFFLFVRFVPQSLALLGVSYFALAAVCSYHFFYFHPWDRVTQFLWVCAAFLFLQSKDKLLATVLGIMTFAKPDALFFPFLYFVVRLKKNRLVPVSLFTGFLFAITWGTNHLLGVLRPIGTQPDRSGLLDAIQVMTAKNLEFIQEVGFLYPPFLVLFLPLVLACLYIRQKPVFLVAWSAYAILVLGPYALLTNLREVRAFLYVLVFILPSALLSLQKLIDHDSNE